MSQPEPNLTVVIPVHNAAPHLGACVESLLAQSYTDFELILVENGSSDDSRERCARYAAEHPGRIRTLTLDEASVSAARNAGIDNARQWWRDDGSKHCKNLFFRNHKGDRHYLVCFDSERSLAIRDLEARLRQGKLTFASPERMERWLRLRPGSVSPFGLINDPENHVHLFLDVNLRDCPAYSFHPNDNRATVVIPQEEFLKYLAAVGNSYEFIELY